MDTEWNFWVTKEICSRKLLIHMWTQCLKITVSLNIASEVAKSSLKCQKSSILASFLNPEACGQTVLPDRSLLLVENDEI